MRSGLVGSATSGLLLPLIGGSIKKNPPCLVCVKYSCVFNTGTCYTCANNERRSKVKKLVFRGGFILYKCFNNTCLFFRGAAFAVSIGSKIVPHEIYVSCSKK